VDDASLEPVALEKEIKFILQTAGEYFTQAPQRSDVLSVFAGLRPLAAPQNGQQKTKEISRSHKIIVSPSRLFTIVGGKWTTYRKMGEDMVDRIEKTLGWSHNETTTGDLKIHGYHSPFAVEDAFSFYGSDAGHVKALMNGDARQWISESLQIHKSQVLWAVQEEMALTVEDVLARRTRALLLDARESIRISRTVAEIMAKALGKDEQWITEQVSAFSAMAGKYVLS
jgi:glycerol-3-phosphate dehydrogenase